MYKTANIDGKLYKPRHRIYLHRTNKEMITTKILKRRNSLDIKLITDLVLRGERREGRNRLQYQLTAAS